MIVVNKNNVVIAVAPIIKDDGTYLSHDNIYYQKSDGLQVIDVAADGIVPQLYLYVDGEFNANPNFVEPEATPETT
jgi:hypothetical protein